MNIATWPDWALKRLAGSRIFVGEVSVANAARMFVVSLGELTLASILISGVIWRVFPPNDIPTLVLVISWVIGALALAQGLAAAWMGRQIVRDLRTPAVSFEGEYLRSLRRPNNERYDDFLDSTGVSPKYAIPLVLRMNGEQDPELFLAPMSYLESVISLDAARYSGTIPKVHGAYLPNTRLISELTSADSIEAIATG